MRFFNFSFGRNMSINTYCTKKNNVYKIVLMYSMAAVDYNLFEKDIYTLNDWSDTSIEIGAYRKGKTLAEKAAWQYVND